MKEEFSSSRSQAVTSGLKSISKAAVGVNDDITQMMKGFAVVSNVIEMFNTLNGSIQNSVKSLKEMKAVGGTLTGLQALQYGATSGGRSSPGVGTSLAATTIGAMAGGAVINASSQFAQTQATVQMKNVFEKVVERIGDKTTDKLTDKAQGVIGGMFAKRLGYSKSSDFTDTTATVKMTGQRVGAGFTPLSPDEDMGGYVRDAMIKAGVYHSPTQTKPSLFSKFMYQTGTEFGSPKNRINLAQGGLAGGVFGTIAGGLLTDGSAGGMAAGGGIGSVVGGIGNVMSGGAMLKSVAALANPVGAAIAAAAAVGASVLLVKGGKFGDKIADDVANFFLGFAESAADKAKKKLEAKLTEKQRRETNDQLRIPLEEARDQALESLRSRQAQLQYQRSNVSRGIGGAGFDTGLEFHSQNLQEANSRLIQARSLAGKGGLSAATAVEQAQRDFDSLNAGMKQMAAMRESGQLAMIDPEIQVAKRDSTTANWRLAQMRSQMARVDNREIKNSDRGFTDVAYSAAIEKAKAATERILELEQKRQTVKQATLEVQKQEFALVREQARGAEQLARNALAAKQSEIEAAKTAYALMGPVERQNTKFIVEKVQKEGFGSLEAEQKEFARNSPFTQKAFIEDALKITGLEADPLLKGAGLTDEREKAAVKQAETMRIDIERKITMQLGLSEEKLGAEAAEKLGPFFKSLQILIEQKFTEAMRQGLERIGTKLAEKGQDGKWQSGGS